MDKETMRIKHIAEIQQRRRKLDGYDAAKPWHSRSYQNEFEGFAERVVQTEKGRRKIKRIYVGSYYELDASDARRLFLKWTHLVFALVSAVFFVMAAGAKVQANYDRLIAFFQVVELLALARMLWLGVRNLFTKKRMIIRQYRYTSRVILVWSRVCAVAALFNGLLSLLFTFLQYDDTFRTGLLCVLWHILSAALMYFSYFIESKQVYRTIANSTPIADDMAVIGNIEI